MVLELLSHRPPPSCITTKILTVAEILYTHTKIVKELPSISFVRGCRIEVSFFTNLLAAYRMGKDNKYLEHHSDRTQRRQISLKTVLSGLLQRVASRQRHCLLQSSLRTRARRW